MRSTGPHRPSKASATPPDWMTRPRALALAICLALAPCAGPASAAGLGRLTVQSALGQPLRAEVEVTSLTADEAASLAARLAAPEAYRQAGLEYNPALAALRFAVEPRGDRTVLKITSTQPINEPFIDMLVELSWATGKLLREYTFLLDPPEAGTSRADAAQPAGAAPAVAPAQTAGASATAGPRAEPRAAAPAAPRVAARAAPTTGGEAAAPVEGAIAVRRGDTLSGLSAGLRPEGTSLEQAMVALYRANPAAFLGNMNRLREGARLSVPDATQMTAVDAAEAAREVRLQSADFAAYRRSLAAAVPSLPAAPAGPSTAGQVSGQVEDRARAAAGDRLTLSKPTDASPQGRGATVGNASAAEQSTAREAALKEANSRIAELEKNVQDLRALLELRNRSMADLQRQVEEGRASQRAVTGQLPGGFEDAKQTDPKQPDARPAAPAPAAGMPSAQPAPAQPAVATAPMAQAESAKPDNTSPAGGAAPPAAAPAPTTASSGASTDTPAPARPASPPASSAPQAAAERGLLDDLLDNPLLLPGLGGIAALGAGYALYAMRRRRKVESFEDSLVASDHFASNSLFGSTGGQSVDTSQGAFASADAHLDAPSTEVDPVAEANVYIAYGREAQAEDILREALVRQPERQPIRFKLMQILAARNDLDGFESLARDMHEMTAGSGEDWEKAAALGASLDPLNPLYGDAEFAPRHEGTGAADAAPGASAANEFDFPDLQLELPAQATRTAAGSPPVADIGEAPRTIDETGLAPATRVPTEIPTLRPVATSFEPAPASTASPQPLAGLPDLDIDLDLELPPKAPATEMSRSGSKTASAQDDSRLDFDLDMQALQSITQMRPPSSPATTERAEMADLDLELEEPVAVESGLAFEGAQVGGNGSARWQEMSTKLDLASAYEEIGDKEGARELLREVLSGGDAQQQQAARAMLGKIG